MNIGILGTGSIARTMVAEFAKVPAFRCEAVCSRQQATGEALAQQFGIPKVYTDYDAMLADPDIELVYIATPNSLHYGQTKAALLAGKNVLCEKPFVPAVAEADELIALAKEKHLFLFEAITTAHHPNYALAKQYLDDIGSLRIVSCTFCQYSSRYDAYKEGKVLPAFDPKLYGGALYDLNVYNLDFALALLGKPEKAEYHPNRGWNGVDTSGVLVLDYPGCRAELTAAKDSDSPSFLQVQGEKGWLRVEGKPIHMESVTWQYTQGPDRDQFATAGTAEKGTERHTAQAPAETNRMVPEFREYARIIRGEWSGEAQECLEWSLEEARILEKVSY